MNLDFSDLHILVIGDSMIDKFVYGRSERLSPEAPVPVMLPEREEYNLGGAANVVCNLLELGAKASLISLVGEDDEGKLLRKLLDEKPVDSFHLQVDSSRKTTTKTRLIINEKQVLRIDQEDTHEIEKEQENLILEAISAYFSDKNYDAVILQDYNKGILTEHLITSCITICNSKNIPVLVDPKHNHFFSFEGCEVFKPNIKELRHILQEDIEITKDALDLAIAKVREQISCKIIIVTLSDKGAYYHDGQSSGIIATEILKSVDVSGAGDTFISMFCLLFSKKHSLHKALEISNLTAGIACTKANVVAINLSEVSKLIRS
jgi:rfaE bifunctional protein kinase chain/domain